MTGQQLRSRPTARPRPVTATPGSVPRLETGELWARRDSAPARDELVRRFLPLARRLASRYRCSPEALDDPRTVADSVGRDDDRLGLVETALSLKVAIAQLPELQRQALALRIEHDMTQTDIARRLGCSQMHVSRLLRRAAANARALIDPCQATLAPDTTGGS